MSHVAARARTPLASVAAAVVLGLLVAPRGTSTLDSAEPTPHEPRRVKPATPVERPVERPPSLPMEEAPSAPTGTILVASWHRICELVTDGTVRCLGNNEFGELGDGTHTARRTWTQVVDLTGVVELALGGEHSCALLRDTTVRCWGANPFGQLGDGTHMERTRPVPVEGLSGVVQIAAGAYHTCARLRGGDVVCWGGNLGGMPIEVDPATAYRAHPSRVAAAFGATSLALGHEHTYAVLDRAHTVESRGFSSPDRPRTVRGLGDAAQLVSGWSHDCMLTRQGRVRCWGSNSYGQLGADTAYRFEDAMPVERLPAVTQIAIGRDHSCARTTTGGVACWGTNEAGQLGGAPGEPTGATIVAGVGDVQQVVCGWDFSCAMGSDGHVRCWGNREYVPPRPDAEGM